MHPRVKTKLASRACLENPPNFSGKCNTSAGKELVLPIRIKNRILYLSFKISHSPSFLSVAVIKHPDTKQLRMERCGELQFQVAVLDCGEVRLELEAASHI